MLKNSFRCSLYISSLLLFLSLNVVSQNNTFNLRKKIAEWSSFSGFKHAGIGLAVCDMGKNELVAGLNPDMSLVPASILKLVTTATALEILGSDFRFQTKLSYSGTIRNDTLFGSLMITGGGDPTLGSEYFPENQAFLHDWVAALKKHGIKVVSGSLAVNDEIYEKEGIPDTWAWEDIGNYYGAGASGISYLDNQYEIHLSSDSVAGRLTRIERITPEIPGLEIENKVLSSDIKGDQTSVFGSPTERLRIIRGTIPKGQSDYAIHASMPDPKAILAQDLKKALANAGIEFMGKDEKFYHTGNETIVFTVQSPQLKDIIKVTNYESINLFAEHFLKHLAYQKLGLGTTAEGCRLIAQFWKEKGVDISGFYMYDGSGLSRFNAITAKQMVQILNLMSTSEFGSESFFQSLPVAGKGTLGVFSAQAFPNDCLHAKSGSMTRVRCYAGYLTTEKGRKLSFAIMLNNFSCKMSETTKKIEELLLEIRKL